MPAYRYYHPIQVRYGDLDPQGHVNNAKYLTFMEQARIAYIEHQGLWDGYSFEDLGIVLAQAQVTFLEAIQYGQHLRVGVRVTRLGTKSLNMEYCLEDSQTHKEMARGSSVVVAYDYRQRQTIPIPEVWRHAIAAFEELPVHGD